MPAATTTRLAIKAMTTKLSIRDFVAIGDIREHYARHLRSTGSVFQRQQPVAAPVGVRRIGPDVLIDDGEWFSLAAPAVTEASGLILQGTRLGVDAISTADGALQWRVATGSAVDAVAVAGNLVAMGGRDNVIRLVRVEDGTEQWTARVLDWVSGLRIDNELLLSGGRDGIVRAWDLRSGQCLWGTELGARILATPIALGAWVFVGARDGRFYQLDRSTGEVINALQTGSDIHGTACVLDDDAIVFGSDDKRIYCVDARTLEIRWMFRTGDSVWAQPLSTFAGVVVASTDGHVYHLDGGSGVPLWEVGVGGPIRLGLSIHRDLVCVVTEGGAITLLDLVDGSAVASGALPGFVWAQPTAARSGFILASRANEVVCVTPPTQTNWTG